MLKEKTHTEDEVYDLAVFVSAAGMEKLAGAFRFGGRSHFDFCLAYWYVPLFAVK